MENKIKQVLELHDLHLENENIENNCLHFVSIHTNDILPKIDIILMYKSVRKSLSVNY